MSIFETQLGRARRGEADTNSPANRPWPIPRGENPYRVGEALAPGSPMFFGREDSIQTLVSRLRSQDKPQSVSLVGERRIGKSSLLNQVYQALGSEPGLLVAKTSLQGFSGGEQAEFFRQLHRALAEGLGLSLDNPSGDFAELRDFISGQAGEYRFVILLDEFERLINQPEFDTNFFANLRTLGYEGRYRLGWLTASRDSLKSLIEVRGIESPFWNIFTQRELGLLAPEAAETLIRRPLLRGLGRRLEKLGPILHFSGRHPAFIQIVMAECWPALQTGNRPDWQTIRRQLRPHFEELWKNRDHEEQKLLLEALDGKPGSEVQVMETLQARGLLKEDGTLFSAFFGECLEQWRPAAPPGSLEGAIDAAHQAGEQVGKLSRLGEKLLKITNQWSRALRGQLRDEDENGA